MWWEFHHLMELTPEQLVDEDGPIGMLEPVGPLDEPKNGKQTWRYPFPPQDFDLGRGEVYDPAQKQARPNDSPFDWSVGEASPTLRPGRSTSGDPSTRPTRARSCRSTGSARSTTRRRSSRSASGSPTTGSRPTARYRRPATCCVGLPPRVGQAAGRGPRPTWRDGSRRQPAGCPDARSDHAPDPGAARVRQDVQRRPHDPARSSRPASASASRRPATRSSAICSRRCSKAATEESRTSTSGSFRGATRNRSSTMRGSPGARMRATSAPGSTTVGPTSPQARPGCGRPRRWSDAVDVLFVDEAGQISLANVVAVSRATDEPRAARRPATARSADAGRASAGSGPIGPRPRPRRTRRRCPPDRGLFLETTWRLHPDLCAFTSEVFYDDRLEPEPHLVGPAPRCARHGARRRGRAASPRGPDRRRGQRVTGGGGRVARVARSIVEGGARWVNEKGELRPVTWDEVLIVAPYNAQVGAIKRRLPPRGPGRDGRQVPGPGGADQHLLADDVQPGAGAARHGLPLLAQPTERRDVAGAVRHDRRRLAGPAARSRQDAGPDAPRQRSVPVRRDGGGGTRGRGAAVD